jgi:hypothetical protein
VYTVRDDALAVIEDLPKAARNLRTALRPARGTPESTIDKVQRAATEIDNHSRGHVLVYSPATRRHGSS